jgi:hypothetical protein
MYTGLNDYYGRTGKNIFLKSCHLSIDNSEFVWYACIVPAARKKVKA